MIGRPTRFPVHAAVVLCALLPATMQSAEQVKYGTGSWSPVELGNHRAVVEVAEPADAVRVHIPWRRRDREPQREEIVVLEAAGGKRLRNVLPVTVNREFGDLIFQAEAAGRYEVYFMPYSAERRTGPPYPVRYHGRRPTAEDDWLKVNGLMPKQLEGGKWKALPRARLVEIQAVNEFHRFDPMELIATGEEMRKLLADHPNEAYLLFPEDRRRPIRMTNDLPAGWMETGPQKRFEAEAQRGEFYAFQVGVYAARQGLEDIQVEFGGLKSAAGAVIGASSFHSFNTSGTDWLGRPITKVCSVAQGKVQPMWFGLQVPGDAAPGRYQGTLALRPKGAEPSLIEIVLDVREGVIADSGDNDLWRQARLRWLDSTIGLDDEIVAPYCPMTVDGRTVTCLGRDVRFNEMGMLESIRSRFPKTVDRVDGPPQELLAAPMRFFVRMGENPIRWQDAKARIVSKQPGAVSWQSQARSGGLALDCRAKMDCDGYINYRIALSADRALKVDDVRLRTLLRREFATYMMGLGHKGGRRPNAWQWKWDVNKANNFIWLGDVNGGLQLKLKGPDYAWSLYDLKDCGIPNAWGNNGLGGCTMWEEGDAAVIGAFSGPRSLAAGETLHFWFGMLITPVKTLDTRHWSWRYWHSQGTPQPDKVAADGVKIINIHQGNRLIPHINYPFVDIGPLADYVKQAHAQGVKVKIYYTVRELSNFVAEMWALRSLGHEVFRDGPGGGASWLREHLVDGYSPAWHSLLPDNRVDAAIETAGLSRWHNYYLEGLGWLVKHLEIDGLYLDGIGYDRQIMKRVRKVMDRARPGCLIDFHCGNHFGFRDLRINNACEFMELFPYIDSLWFGEGFSYDETPDYWLVEMSGIPFGLFGEMLGGSGNPWRGMIYGMTDRLGWGGKPQEIWKLWDSFGIAEARMIGYWVPDCPVKTDNRDVLATAYVRQGRTLVSLASWAKTPVKCRLTIDWEQLGLDPKKASLTAPAIPGLQEAARFAPGDHLPVAPAKGWLLIVE